LIIRQVWGIRNRNLQTDSNSKNKGVRLLWRPGYRFIPFNAALGTGLDHVDWSYVVQQWSIVEWPALVKRVMDFEVPYKRA
jgi:hypothetical protein